MKPFDYQLGMNPEKTSKQEHPLVGIRSVGFVQLSIKNSSDYLLSSLGNLSQCFSILIAFFFLNSKYPAEASPA